jgi:ubiquitin-protein ligase
MSKASTKNNSKLEKKLSIGIDINDDSVWSDEESDYVMHIQAQPKKELVENAPFKSLPVRPKYFSGEAKVTAESKDIMYVKPPAPTFKIPLPYVPPQAYEALGSNVVHQLWNEFIKHDADASELVLTEHIPSISNNMTSHIGYELPFKDIKINNGEDEYVDFKYILDQLTYLVNTNENYRRVEVRKKALPLPPCCVHGACRIHTSIKEIEDKMNNTDITFQIEQAYLSLKSKNNGNVRIKHIPQILIDAGLSINTKVLADNWWKLNGENLIICYADIEPIANQIRTDIEIADDDKYPLPRWMQNEFTPLELKMFRHHFGLIDVDGGGTVDAQEMQNLIIGLGTKITLEQAQNLIDQYDMDKSGSIDFEEFMTLMYKIQQGTIDLENDYLAQALLESKHQVVIYEEIENIKQNPPEFIRVYHYGGNPVKADYIISGPPGSIYEGGDFIFSVEYVSGYPYTMPNCCFSTRIFALNVITQMSGSGGLPHITHFWESSWNTRQLLQHVIFVLLNPDPSLLSPSMTSIINGFLKENYDIEEGDGSGIVSEFGEEQSVGTYSGSLHESDTFRNKLKTLPRLEQMHMNVVSIFLTNREAYDNIARQYVQKYAQPIATNSD